MSNADVVIVGAGAIGAAAAYELTRAGASVCVLERALDGSGCSFGNAGLISPSHSDTLASPASVRSAIGWLGRADSPLRISLRPALAPWLARFLMAAQPRRAAAASAELRALTAASLELHAQLADAGLATSFRKQGILGVYETDGALEEAAERLRARGESRVERLAFDEARGLLPRLRSPIAGALLYADEAHCDPGQFVNALLDGARELGAEIRPGVEVLGLEAAGSRVTALHTTAGRVAAGSVVLAAGVWTRSLVRDLGMNLPLEGGKGYHLELPASPAGALPAFFEEARITATPLDGRLRITGMLDLSGLDTRINPRALAAVERTARRLLEFEPDVGPSRVWRGLRPCSPDGLPIIGRAAEFENLLIATAHAMLGIALAPVTAEIVGDLVAGRAARFPVGSFSAERFGGRFGVLQNGETHRYAEINAR